MKQGQATSEKLGIRGFAGRGIPAEHFLQPVYRELGEQGSNDAMTVGDGILAAAALQVVVEGHKGVEAEAVLGDAPDKGLRLGRGPTVGEGDGPLLGEVLGEGAELDDGQLLGTFAAKGVEGRRRVS